MEISISTTHPQQSFRGLFYRYCHHFSVEISINYFIRFRFHRFVSVPEARAGRPMQAEVPCRRRQHILRPVLGVRWRPAGTLRLPQRPCVRRQKSWCHRRLRLSMEGCVLRRKAERQWDNNVTFNPLISLNTNHIFQTGRSQTSTAIGCMEYSDTRHHARDTGHAGTEPQQSSSASADCFITSKLTAVIGQRLAIENFYNIGNNF